MDAISHTNARTVSVTMPADIDRASLARLLEQTQAGQHITTEIPDSANYHDLHAFARRERLEIHHINGQVILSRTQRPRSLLQAARDFLTKPHAF